MSSHMQKLVYSHAPKNLWQTRLPGLKCGGKIHNVAPLPQPNPMLKKSHELVALLKAANCFFWWDGLLVINQHTALPMLVFLIQ